MDALYDNLENYDESKLIEELRNENQELKAKIEKYSMTLEKLQKDFDKIAAEYKKLEMNYSSLLKTARAEVERKTQIITKLNTEKDIMVLNAIQNKNVLNVRRPWATGNLNHSKGNEAAAQSKKEANEQKSQSSSAGRKEASKTPTEVTNNPVSTENTNKLNIKNEKCVDRVCDTKENDREVQKDKPCRPAGIRDRRKSLPATSFREVKFSSDEEGEVTDPIIKQRKEPVSKESDSWRNSDRNPTKDNPMDRDPYNRNRNYDNDKYRKDRFQPQRHRLSPERFHRRLKRDYSGDRRFLRDKDHRQHRDSSGGYRSDKDGERYRRDGSGDNRHYRDRSGDCRPYRDNSGDCRPYKDSTGNNKSRREESGDHKKPEMRKRRLESPIGDKFQQYQQKNHEEFERDYNDERNKYLEDLGKRKYHSDYEVPSKKRMRSDSYHRSDQDNKCPIGKALDQAPQPAVENIQSEDMSCQSPDYLTTELASVPKEIKFDAEVNMDDPREHSNKYKIRTENGEKVLTTVAGRNVELKPVNKSVWNIIEVEIPIALVRRPSQSPEDRIDEVYGGMDIDANSDISSIESGETMGSLYDISTDPFHYDYSNDVRRKEKNRVQTCYVKTTAQDDKGVTLAEKGIEYSQNTENVSTQKEKVDDMQEKVAIPTDKNVEETHKKERMQAESVTEYPQTFDKEVIPAGKVAEGHHADENVTGQFRIDDPKSSERDSIQTARVVKSSSCEKETLLLVNKVKETVDPKESLNICKSKYKIPKLNNKDKSGIREKSSDNKHNEVKSEVDKLDNVPLKHKSANTNTVVDATEKRSNHVIAVSTGKGMVEGDLELSDESNDIDLMKRVKEVVEQSPCILRKITTVNNDFDDKDGKIDDVESMREKSIICNVKKSVVDLKLSVKDKSESSDTSQKGKSKNKTTKHSLKLVKETMRNSKEDDGLSKHSRLKLQDTEAPKDIKSKFSDLFGDSSSLITPEDLGLTAQEVRIESSSSNYFPIFEDAQDAADLGVNVNPTKTDLLVILENPHVDVSKPSKNTEQNNGIDNDENITHLCKSIEKEIHNDKIDITEQIPQHSKCIKQEHVKPNDINEIKTKSCKNFEKEHVGKKIYTNETKTKTNKNLEKQQVKKVNADETKSKAKSSKNTRKEQHVANSLDSNDNTNEIIHKTKDSKNETDELINKDTCKNAEIDKCDKPLDSNQNKSKTSKETEKIEAKDIEPKLIEVRRKKTRRPDKSQQLTIETGETPQPAVITVENITTSAQLTSDTSSLNTKELEVVKTEIISSGIQPLSVHENLPVNVISPILEQPVTPNINSRQTQLGIPVLTHSVHIHALATSTPAKEIIHLQDVSCKTPDVSNTSNDQNSVSNNIDSNDMEAPDVRIFVKRRRRVVKKTTPSKT